MPDDQVPRWTLQQPSSLREIVEHLNSHGLGTVFVTDADGVLVATVTDGDIRRALLAGHGLDSNAAHAFNTDFLRHREGSRETETNELAQAKKLSHIPVVDQSGQFVRVLSTPRVKAPVSQRNSVVIMAGGRGLRLRPLTETTPKPLLPVAGKPILQRIIENLRSEGFTDIIVAVNYLAESIIDFFGDGADFGVSIRYLKEEQELGTAGALTLLSEPVDAPIVVMNGDLLLGASIANMIDYHRKAGGEITVGAKTVETPIPYGVLSTEGSLVRSIEEKPVFRSLVNVGVYVVNPNIIQDLPRGEPIDMPDVVAACIPQSTVFAYPIYERWADLGRLSDFARATDLLTEGPN